MMEFPQIPSEPETRRLMLGVCNHSEDFDADVAALRARIAYLEARTSLLERERANITQHPKWLRVLLERLNLA